MIGKHRLFVALIAAVAAMALAGCSGGKSATDPQPDPTSDYATNMVNCLAAKGWDVQRNPDGTYSSRYPDEQSDQYDADVAACRAQFGYEELAVTEEQASNFYDKLVASAECLRGLGYDISDPPSRQSYVETLVGGELPDWAPYTELLEMAGSAAEVQEAEAACPQPSTW